MHSFSSATADPFGFGGQFGYYTDSETGLILCTHRFYDPAAGRFLTRDPMGYAGGVNLYAYVQNNPVNESDPSGFDAIDRLVDPDDTGADSLTGNDLITRDPCFGQAGLGAASNLLGDVPIVGQVLNGISGITGHDGITGESLSGTTRAIDIIGIIAGLLPYDGPPAFRPYRPPGSRYHWHHPVPIYLGGPRKQWLVNILVEYHDLIHDEFNRLYPERRGAGYYTNIDWTQLWQDIGNIYQQYPLPQGSGDWKWGGR